MKTRTKKLTALLLAAAMAATLAACGDNGNTQVSEEKTASAETSESASAEASSEAEEELYYNKEGFPIVKEPITISVAGVTGATLDWQNTYMVKKIEEMMGIKMECNTYADASVWSTQYATMVVSDSLPDLMMQLNVSKATTNEHGADGYLLDLTDYLDVMPNFAKFLEENPEYATFTKAPDGSIYSIDRVRPVETPAYGLYVSKEHQEKYGFDVDDIKTVEDFYNVLSSIKAQNPDAIPLSLTLEGNCGQRGEWALRSAFDIYSTELTYLLDVDDQGKVSMQDIDDNYKAYLKFLNTLWEEKLLDQESFIMTNDEYRSKIRTEEIVFWADWSGAATALSSDKSVYQEYDLLVALTSEWNDVPTYVHLTPYNGTARVMVSASTKYPEAVCRLIDYAYSEEGQIFYNYGVEGETFDYVEDGLGNKAVNSDNYWDSTKYSSVTEWRNQAVAISNALQLVIPSESRIIVNEASDEQLETFISGGELYPYTQDAHMEKYIREQTEVEMYPTFLPLAYTQEENDGRNQLTTDMGLLLKQYRAQFITGALDIDENWDKYVTEIKGFWDQIQPFIQSAQDRFNANK